MKQCLRITCRAPSAHDSFQEFIQQHARTLSLEGVARIISATEARISACGPKEALESFVDLLYKGTPGLQVESIDVEPFFNDKDFRGVFRIIE